MLDMLRDGPLTTGDLSAAFPELSRFAVMQHLGVLTEANLVIVQRQGRQRFNYLNAVPIREIYERWVSRYAGHWASALIGLKRALEQPEDAMSASERLKRASTKAPATKKRIPKASARNPKGRAR
jgi:DNA-binding transcriptional ArsR family regulator